MEDGLVKLTVKEQLSVYTHEGFWKAMDTYREMEELNNLWENGPKWKIWK